MTEKEKKAFAFVVDILERLARHERFFINDSELETLRNIANEFGEK